MLRSIYNEDHEAFRAMIRDFIESEVVPAYPEWEKAGHPPRDFYLRLGELGVHGIHVPEEYGGAGETSYKFEAIIMEETSRAGVTFGAEGIHVNLVRPYLLSFASEEQKQRWMPKFVTGEMMGALAMTEPGTGSDLAGISTTAKLSADGTHYVLNGAKTFISGGVLADRVLVVARTSPSTPEDRRGGLSILFVDTKSPGYTVGKKLDKIGLKTSDTAELAFQDVKVPVEDLLGEEGQAFKYLTHNLVEERLAIVVGSTAQAAAAIGFAVAYVKERKAFGQPVAAFQNTKFVLADCEADYQAAQAMTDRAVELFDQGKLTPADAAACKLFCTEAAGRIIDKCLQLHGGYGYINEYPIARLYADTRVSRLYGGTSEIMRTIIAKSLGL
ncbi:acyl-CoA dehydrogenase family protein [Actinospica robiniae]|uniref:acyl-CoA dehydrogenase family protein n=1 Tax=Actinospica robiniae TaxID=304901 RepID=UPI0003FC1B35|nr:acyl-CoA dehydrogenase family protein [Actinospica robiniae]